MGDAPVFVAGDLAGVGADALGEVALGPGLFCVELHIDNGITSPNVRDCCTYR